MITILELPKRVRCPECEALLKFEASDVQVSKSNKGHSHRFITCPCCKKYIILNSETKYT